MTKPIATETAVPEARPHVAPPARAGLFLVKPSPERRVQPSVAPRGPRSLGLWTLAAAALAAPLLWWMHELLQRMPPR